MNYNKTMNTIGQCFAVIVSKFLPFEKNLIVLYTSDFFEGIFIEIQNKLNIKYTYLVLNKNYDYQPVLNYIVMSNNLSNFYKIFGNSKQNLFSRYLIITELSDNLIMNLAHYLWQHKFAYIAVLGININKKIIKIYQHKSNCKNCKAKELAISLVGYCRFYYPSSININGSFQAFSEIICPVNVCDLRLIRVDYGAMFEELYNFNENGTQTAADSIGACILEAFAELYNITITRQDVVSNYNWHNSVQEMNNGHIDVSFGPTLPNHYLVTHLEKGSSYEYEKFIFVDVIPKTLPSLSIFITPLETEVWIFFIIIALTFCLFIKLLKATEESNLTFNRLGYLHLVAMHFNQYIRPPKKWGLRVVFGMWLLYALFMNAIYNCNFVSTIIKVKPKNMLETFNDILHSKRRIGGPDVATEWLNDSKDSVMMELCRRYEIINPDNVSYALHKQKMVVAQTDYVILKTGMSDVYILGEIITSYPLLYYLPKGHPYSMFILQFIENIKAGGIPLLKCQSTFRKDYSNKFKAVSMVHLQVLFKLLLLSHLISSILFLVEYFM